MSEDTCSTVCCMYIEKRVSACKQHVLVAVAIMMQMAL
jgi:hypothetical protein